MALLGAHQSIPKVLDLDLMIVEVIFKKPVSDDLKKYLPHYYTTTTVDSMMDQTIFQSLLSYLVSPCEL